MEIQQLAKIKEEALREIAQTSDENTLLTIYKNTLLKKEFWEDFSNQSKIFPPTNGE